MDEDDLPPDLTQIRGFLIKQSEILGRWLRKYISFCETDHVLKWYSSDNNQEAARGWIDLRGFGFQFSEECYLDFTITNSTGSWSFQALDEESASQWQDWLNLLKDCPIPLGHPAHAFHPRNFCRAAICCFCQLDIPGLTKETYCAGCSQSAHAKCLQSLAISKRDPIAKKHLALTCKLETLTCNCGPLTHFQQSGSIQ